ncbi:hypothetical protein [Viridibacterium curvum]|uniref:Tfp pilus assembly protein PilX n=1 Tax=Viridibacterium curvum TaxID=1101404 RepID=A0ABP9QBZ2_9RHOO
MKTIPKTLAPAARVRRAGTQRGITIIIALVAMLILLFSGMALLRSFDSTLALSGNMAFKRDLVNQGERGMQSVWTMLKTTTLVDAATRQNSVKASNYSAVRLATDAKGIPLQLLGDDTTFATVGTVSNDIVDTNSSVTIRYLIDRLCTSVGEAVETNCSMSAAATSATGGSDYLGNKRAGSESNAIYRISVRVIGPRGTVAYLQSNVAL